MEQVPTANKVTVLPEIVQFDGVADMKETARPELDEALTANGLVPNATLLRDPKVIVCGVEPEPVVIVWELIPS